jgi:Secretion system C-terminal sorting domain
LNLLKKIQLALIFVTLYCNTNAQYANAVFNPSFTTNLNNWTAEGDWKFRTGGYAATFTNGTATEKIAQTLNNVRVVANTITIEFDFRSTNCTGCSAANSYTNMDVSFGGTTYLTFSALIGSGGVTTSTSGGATVSNSAFAQGNAWTRVTLTIPWTGSDPASGELAFTHRPNGGWDDVWVDNIYVSSISLLPLKLIRFEGNNNKEYTKLTWLTANEENINYFEIQQSNDAVNFNTIGKVAANNTALNNYQFQTKLTGYFRLKTIEKNQINNSDYSNVVYIDNPVITNGAYIYPNPAVSNTFQLSTPIALNNTTAKIFSVEGKMVKAVTIITEKQTINVGNLLAGVFFIRLDNGQTIKLVKL